MRAECSYIVCVKLLVLHGGKGGRCVLVRGQVLVRGLEIKGGLAGCYRGKSVSVEGMLQGEWQVGSRCVAGGGLHGSGACIFKCPVIEILAMIPGMLNVHRKKCCKKFSACNLAIVSYALGTPQ